MGVLIYLLPDKYLFTKWLKVKRVKFLWGWNRKYYRDDCIELRYALAKIYVRDLFGES